MLSSIKHRNNKQKYYLLNYLGLLIPDFLFRNSLKKKLNSLSNFDYEYIKNRVNYYNKLNKKSKLNELCNDVKSYFEGNLKIIDSKWMSLKKLFKKKNISRKECILLPFKALERIIKN